MKIKAFREVSLAAGSLAEVHEGLAAVTGHGGYELQEEPTPPIQARFRSYAVGDRSIAVMESMGQDTPITRYLDRWGAGAFSVTVEVADMKEATEHLAAKRAKVLLAEPIELDDVRSGSERFEKIRVNWVSPSGPMHGLAVELQELSAAQPARDPEPPADPSVPVAVNEIHFAVRDLDAATRDISELLGLDVGPEIVQAQPPEEVRYHNLSVHGRPFLALIAPATETSAIHRFLSRRGQAIYTISMRAPDVHAYADRVREAGLQMLFDEPKSVSDARIGATEINGASINWVRPQPAANRVLFEVQQYENS